MPRDLDNGDLDLVENMASSGKTVTDVARAFCISEHQVWKFLGEPFRERLAVKFRENLEKKEAKSAPATARGHSTQTPDMGDQVEQTTADDHDEEAL